MSLWENIRTATNEGSNGEGWSAVDSSASRTAQPSERVRHATRETGVEGDMANIGKSISIKGDVVGEEDTVIEGRVEGRLELKSHHLTIGPNGDVQGEILAKQVTIVGRVAGNVVATERAELRDSARVEGDLSTPRLLVQEGARVNGKISMVAAAGAMAPLETPAIPTRLDVQAS